MRKLGLRFVLSVLPATFVLLASASLASAAGPDPNQPYIESISYDGTGCPQGSAGMSISDDRKSFTMIFDIFVASVGPNLPASEQNKNCTITVHMHLAPGWQTWVQSVSRRGYVQLSGGSDGSSKAAYVVKAPSSSGESNGQSGVNQNSQVNFTGPVATDYLGGDGLSITAHAPNTCNEVPGRRQDLTIQVETSLTGTGLGQITVDSVDGKLAVTSLDKSKSCH